MDRQTGANLTDYCHGDILTIVTGHKKLPKVTNLKNPHAHLHYVHNKHARVQKDPVKTVGGVDYTICIP